MICIERGVAATSMPFSSTYHGVPSSRSLPRGTMAASGPVPRLSQVRMLALCGVVHKQIAQEPLASKPDSNHGCSCAVRPERLTQGGEPCVRGSRDGLE